MIKPASDITAPATAAVLANQGNFFFLLLFVLIKHTATNSGFITTSNIVLKGGARWAIAEERCQGISILFQA